MLRAVRVQPEPILLLHDEPLELEDPARAPDLRDGRITAVAARQTSIRARPGPTASSSQTATIATRARSSSARAGRRRIMALLVSTTDPGLHVFPTHRIVLRPPRPRGGGGRGERRQRRRRRFHSSRRSRRARSAAVAYRRGTGHARSRCRGRARRRARRPATGSTASGTRRRATRPSRSVDRGDADVAFLLRAPRVEDVFAAARRGERMPPKSTYFFPKPLSGLLFHPVELVTDWLATCRLVRRRHPRRARAPADEGRARARAAARDRAGTTRRRSTRPPRTPWSSGSRRSARTSSSSPRSSASAPSGPGGPTRVVVDPIDGSVNAKRGIPFFSFSLAVAEGATMRDVVFGYVYDFGTGEEWTAERGKGAFLQREAARAGRAQGVASRSSPSRGRPLPP